MRLPRNNISAVYLSLAWQSLSIWVMNGFVTRRTLDRLRGASRPFKPLFDRMVVRPSENLLKASRYGIDRPTVSFEPLQRVTALTYAST